ncbi:MAG: galactitol-1-phosphate 5-dehydrogenase [Oscillospiraceae bacterium]|nr:galactitol-1-phosphate 5-dehydrogenase [Oscillospiraceae bacterium]
MKCLNLHAIGDLRYESIETPVCEDDEVLVKIRYCGICGSDVPRVFVKGTHRFPLVIGHEFSGVVAEDRRGEWTGRNVAVYPLLPCFSCPSCRQQRYEACEHYDYYGSRRNGGMAEYIAVKRWNVIPLPEKVPLKLGALCEPVSVAHHAVGNLGDITGKNVLISGAGPIGLIVGQWCMAKGAAGVYYFDIDPRKIEFAESMGFHAYDAQTIHACVEGTGVSAALARCLQAVAPGATLVLMGNPAGAMTLSQEEYWHILRKELIVRGTWNSSYSETKNDWRDSIQAISDGTLQLEKIITHVFAPEEYRQAFETARDKAVFSNKILIEWNK